MYGISMKGIVFINIWKHASNWYGYLLFSNSINLSNNAIIADEPPSKGDGLAPYLKLQIILLKLLSRD